MGFLSSLLDPAGLVTGEKSDNLLGVATGLDPAGVLTGTGLAGGEFGEIGQMIADPLDLFGHRAEETRGEVGRLLTESAESGIKAQEEQRQKIKEMYAPFYDSAVEGGLPQLQALAMGGEVDYTPSRLYEYSKERGERNIRRTQAAKGQLKSSATEERLSDLRLGLAEEETERLYSGQLSRVQLGAGAGDAVGAASRTLGGNVAGLYTGLGSGMRLTEQAYGEARQSAFQGLSSSLMGMAKYMEAA